jgi:glycosyltransferase involved in cell wall biosynthesis
MEKKPKIAYVHNGYWPSQSPCFTFTTMTVLGLAKHTDRTYFFIQENSSEPPKVVLRKKFDISLPSNLEIYPVSGSQRLKAHKFYYGKVYKHIKELINKGQLDAVISRNVTFLPYLIKIKKKFKLPVYFESHDFFADLSIRDDISGNRKREMRLERRYIDQLTGLICLHKPQKDVYQYYFPYTEIIVAKTGLTLVQESQQSDKKYLGYIGSLDKHKGVVQIFKAAALSNVKPPILIIGGKSEEEIDQFRQLADKYYDLNKVNITGWVDKKKVNAYLSKVKIGVLPLKNTFFNKSITSPLKLFDFFAHNIPVIAPHFPTMNTLIFFEKTGLFYDAQNPKNLVENIDKLFQDRELYESMKNYIDKYKINLTWDIRAKNLIDNIRPDLNE